MLLRVGLLGAGGIMLHLASAIVFSAPMSRVPGDIYILILSGIAGLLLVAAGGIATPPAAFRWLILLVCVGELGSRAVIWAQTTAAPDLVTVDPALYTDMAGELLLHGENPYGWDLSGAFELYRTSQEASTPRLDGANTSIYPYPALPFLSALPFLALDLPGAFLESVLAQAAVLVLLFIAAPRRIQPLILLPIVVGVDFTSLTLIGVIDIVWIALLVSMVVAWRHLTLRAVLFGLAVAFKQGPWLIAPFLAVRIWRDEERNPLRQVAYFVMVSASTFLAVNGPFILWDPQTWLRGVMEPLSDDLVLFSHGGLSTLSQFGLMDLPKSFFLVATLSVLALLLFCYWRHYAVLEHTIWMMPGVVMWFSYRSLISYWAYWLFPIMATIATCSTLGERTQNNPAWKPTLAVVSVVLGALFCAGVWLSFSPGGVRVQLQYPLALDQGRVTWMNVEVENRSDRVLTPRFALQHRRAAANPLPWYIDYGPRTLPPGQSAIYRISTSRDDRSVFAFEAAQLVVTDAEGDYSLRGVAPLEHDLSFLWPDAIPNPAFRFWDSQRTAPVLWELMAEPTGSGMVRADHSDSRGALRLTLDAVSEGRSNVALQSLISLPLQPFHIWLFLDPSLENASAVTYGVEIDDGAHQLRFLYRSDEQTHAVRAEQGQYVIDHVVPPRTWVLEEIDVIAAYAEAGWALPALRPAIYRDLETDLRLVNLRLFLAVEGPSGSLEARFGPIEQDGYQVEPQILIAETLDDPAGYYARLAETYTRERNYARALDAYEHLLDWSPNAARVPETVDHFLEQSVLRRAK